MNRATLDGPPEATPAAAVHTQAADHDEDPSAAETMTASIFNTRVS
jgi:hypothetical protein